MKRKNKQLFGHERSLPCDLLPMLYRGAAADVLPNFPLEILPVKNLKSRVDFGEMTCFRLLLWKKVDIEQIRIKRLTCSSEN